MAILKVIEVLAESAKSWEDAARIAIAEAGKTVKNIKSAYVQEQSVVIDKNKITKFRVNLKVSFAVVRSGK